VYYEGGSILGCHYCLGLNHIEIGFYDVLRKALRTTLNSIINRRGGKGYGIDVIVIAIKCYPLEVKSHNCYMLEKYQNNNPILQRGPKERPYTQVTCKITRLEATPR